MKKEFSYNFYFPGNIHIFTFIWSISFLILWIYHFLEQKWLYWKKYSIDYPDILYIGFWFWILLFLVALYFSYQEYKYRKNFKKNTDFKLSIDEEWICIIDDKWKKDFVKYWEITKIENSEEVPWIMLFYRKKPYNKNKLQQVNFLEKFFASKNDFEDFIQIFDENLKKLK